MGFILFQKKKKGLSFNIYSIIAHFHLRNYGPGPGPGPCCHQGERSPSLLCVIKFMTIQKINNKIIIINKNI